MSMTHEKDSVKIFKYWRKHPEKSAFVIARELGVTSDVALRVLKARGYEPHRGNQWTPDKLDEIRQLLASGYSSVAIAKRFGVGAKTIYNLCSKYRIKSGRYTTEYAIARQEGWADTIKPYDDHLRDKRRAAAKYYNAALRASAQGDIEGYVANIKKYDMMQSRVDAIMERRASQSRDAPRFVSAFSVTTTSGAGFKLSR